ncbi:D-glycero-beta-D-manno-heptose 1-phosphate adenylyltransferase [Labedaea rhizosphaerae]|uniref:Bifunctional protein HldE n=1 Tax=Labedaea rhizosphaerae TaxID=598644 RepID=A0A4R6S967_LABRH|nr:D-glycero-beta-D-manno-heptose 1-phosphate adenylyltransferase [Labedaea rhizosphaerae]TDP96462.1 rfaE bifunctional protein kinase chain/domain/rfaE bifunctional protein nucleotidyltransferase chain/domain [Labedaea rhizosphaerae]
MSRANGVNHYELSAELPGLVAGRAPTVYVLGDVILDEWLSGTASRLCREAPAPVVEIEHRMVAPGGAANTAVNLAALGARVRLVSAVGDDEPGRELRSALATAGVDTELVAASPRRRTVAKRRIVAGDQVLLRYDDGVGRRADAPAPLAVDVDLSEADAVVLCDYGLGVLDSLHDAVRAARPGIGLLVVDAHHPGRWRDLRPDLVTPNAAELEALLGAPVSRTAPERDLANRRDALHEATGATTVVVTLDRDGAVLVREDGSVHRTWARPVPDTHTAGAGDTFCAALTSALAAGLPDAVSVEFAQAAADVVVHRPGTAVCGTVGLAERLSSFHGAVLSHDRLAEVVAEHRERGRRVVFTNGCFDVLHSGHVAYLNQAKQLGDVLVVAVNSDAGVARLKGPGRPVNPIDDRVAVIAALSCVDHVTVFDDDTATGLLSRLRPDIYAKGGDYTPEMLAETRVVRDYGGVVRIVDYVEDHSTSAVIDRIRDGSTA